MHSLGKRKKSSEEMNVCKTILRNLFSKRYKSFAWIFYQPVDADFLGLYNYHQVVKKPMDMSTVRHRLYSNYYLSPPEFAHDMRLIFYNAYLYTTRDHVCFEMALNLQKVFEKMYVEAELESSSDESFVWSDSDSDSSSELDVETPWNLNDNTSYNDNCNTALNRSMERSISETSTDPHVLRQPQLEESEICIEHLPMSAEEDLDLHIKVQQLDGVMLLNVIHMIHQLEGLNFVYPNKEIEFDVSNLKPHTKRSILAYMASKGVTGKRVSRPMNPYN